jgi:hypothetical protein
MHQNPDHDSHEWVLISAQPQVSSIIHTYFSLFSTIVAATSVDAERAFSTGRRQINFTQHNINSQTFRALIPLSDPRVGKSVDRVRIVTGCIHWHA